MEHRDLASVATDGNLVAWMKRSVIRGRPAGRKCDTRHPKSVPGGTPRIPAFGLHPGYTERRMEIAIHGTP